MKKKLYLCLVIFLITMPTIITMNCVKDGFMCQFALNCCNKLCNAYGFCHRGYQGTNLDPMEIINKNKHLAPNAKPIQFNPAIFDLPPNPVPSPPNPGMFNNYPNGPWGFTGNNNPNGPWGNPGNNNLNGPRIPPVNSNGPWNPTDNNPNGPWNPSTVNPLGNPPPNANFPADVYNDKPDSNPLRLHHF